MYARRKNKVMAVLDAQCLCEHDAYQSTVFAHTCRCITAMKPVSLNHHVEISEKCS